MNKDTDEIVRDIWDFSGYATLIFVVQKLSHQISWNWWLVFLPAIIGVVVFVLYALKEIILG